MRAPRRGAPRPRRVWNTLTGTTVSAVDAQSQVCALAWSRNANELVACYGAPAPRAAQAPARAARGSGTFPGHRRPGRAPRWEGASGRRRRPERQRGHARRRVLDERHRAVAVPGADARGDAGRAHLARPLPCHLARRPEHRHRRRRGAPRVEHARTAGRRLTASSELTLSELPGLRPAWSETSQAPSPLHARSARPAAPACASLHAPRPRPAARPGTPAAADPHALDKHASQGLIALRGARLCSVLIGARCGARLVEAALPLAVGAC